MNQKKIPLLSGSIFGLTAVLFGAFGAHYLKTFLTSSQMTIFETGVRYQMYHALVLCIIGFFMLYNENNENKLLFYSTYAFSVGIILFSGSLYIYTSLNIFAMVFITPIGGSFLILGWLLLFYYAFSLK